jgi:hypothetical protein
MHPLGFKLQLGIMFHIKIKTEENCKKLKFWRTGHTKLFSRASEAK